MPIADAQSVTKTSRSTPSRREASRTQTNELGINPGPGGFDIPVTFSRGAGEDGGGSLRLSDLRGVSSRDWVTSLPSARIAALFGSSDTNLLQSPRIRASDGAQASLRIGDRIPVATGSFQPGVGGVGINPLVNTQFQYQDVGVNVDKVERKIKEYKAERVKPDKDIQEQWGEGADVRLPP